MAYEPKKLKGVKIWKDVLGKTGGLVMGEKKTATGNMLRKDEGLEGGGRRGIYAGGV